VLAGYFGRICHGEFAPTQHYVYEIVLVVINKGDDSIRQGTHLLEHFIIYG